MKQTAIKAAKLAGKIMLENYGNVGKISFKENDRSILTKVDLEAEKVILDTIKNKFPGHNIISEESPMQNKNSEYTWIIDPIDGTTNFTQEIPYFCTAIAAAKNNKIILGVVYNPLTKELFVAEKGKGAFLNNKKIRVSDKNNVNEATFHFGVSSTHIDIAVDSLNKIAELYPHVRDVRIFGSAELNLCYIACSRLDIYITKFTYPWDVAAGYIIIEEAGGKVTDLEGKPWTLNKKQVLATNKKLHNKFLNLLNKK